MTSLSSFSLMVQKELFSAMTTDYLDNFILKQIGTHLNYSPNLPFFNEELSYLLPPILENDFHYRESEKFASFNYQIKTVIYLEQHFCKFNKVFKILDKQQQESIFKRNRGTFNYINFQSTTNISSANIIILHDFHQSPLNMITLAFQIYQKYQQNCNIIIPFIHQMMDSQSSTYQNILKMLKKLLGTMYKEDQFTIIAQGIMSNMALDMSKIPQAKKVILISPIVKFKIIINSEFKKKTNRINRISYVDEFSMQSELQLCQNDKMESEISGEIIEVKQECEQSHKLKYQALESKFVLVKIQNEELKQVKKIKSSEGHTTSIYKDVIINYEELGIVQNIISTNILKGQYLYTRSFNNLMYKIYSNKIIKQKICDTFRINSIYEDSRLQDVYQIIKQISSVNGTSKKKKLLSKYIIMFNIYSQLDKYNELNQQINMLDDDYFQSMQQFYNFQFIDASSVSNRTVCQVIVSPHDLLLSYSTLDTLQLMQQLNKVQVRTIIGTGHDILNATVVSIANLVFG